MIVWVMICIFEFIVVVVVVLNSYGVLLCMLSWVGTAMTVKGVGLIVISIAIAFVIAVV